MRLGQAWSLEGRDDDGERRGRQDGASHPLDCADRDHLGAVLRDAGADARQGEDGHAGEIDLTTPEVVGGPTTQQQESREGQDVGVDDPLRAGVR